MILTVLCFDLNRNCNIWLKKTRLRLFAHIVLPYCGSVEMISILSAGIAETYEHAKDGYFCLKFY
jgi:hypothetical protein